MEEEKEIEGRRLSSKQRRHLLKKLKAKKEAKKKCNMGRWILQMFCKEAVWQMRFAIRAGLRNCWKLPSVFGINSDDL